LAEILPNTTPSSSACIEIHEEGDSDQSSDEDIPEYDISDTSKSFQQDEEIACVTNEASEQPNDSCSASDDTPDVNREDLKTKSDTDVLKFILELDPEENLALFYSQHSFKLTKLRYCVLG
jgi:hypothetical protein